MRQLSELNTCCIMDSSPGALVILYGSEFTFVPLTHTLFIITFKPLLVEALVKNKKSPLGSVIPFPSYSKY